MTQTKAFLSLVLQALQALSYPAWVKKLTPIVLLMDGCGTPAKIMVQILLLFQVHQYPLQFLPPLASISLMVEKWKLLILLVLNFSLLMTGVVS
jgi:hypothetical protein